MANESKFHILSVSYDEDERQKRKERAKVFPFSEIWSLFYDDTASPNDEVNSVDKFAEYLREEVLAIEKAHYPEDGQHEKTYMATPQNSKSKKSKKTNKKSARSKFSDVATKFFHEEDEYFKTYEVAYQKYLAEETAAKKLEKGDEREAKLKELKEQYKDAIDAFNRCKEAYIEFEKYEATVNFLDSLPKSVLVNILEFRKMCDDKGCPELFAEGFNDLLSYTDLMPEYKDRDGKKLINEHRLSLGIDNKVITHSIRNLNGSDLDITIVNNGITIARCGDNMTQEQLNALADYCHKTGAKVTDFGGLAKTQVVDNNGKEIGVIEEEYKKALANAKNENQQVMQTQGDEPQIPAYDSYFGNFIKQEKITAKKEPVKLFGKKLGEVETPSGLDINKSEAAIRKFIPSAHISKDYKRGKTIIKVYDKEEDEEEDNRLDEKGKQKHTKRFAISFDNSRPRASIYLGSKEKMTPDLARAVLDTVKAQGYKYFTFPPLTSEDGFGKEGQAAFLKASVKTGMVILLKGKDGKGCDIGVADLTTIMKEVKEEQNFIDNPAQKIEYLMRWHEQLEKYCAANPKKVAELSDHVEKIKQQAQFTMFEKSYKGLIDDEINKGIQGDSSSGAEPWDDVDVIAAQHAYTQVVKNIKNGHLGGKRYNPLDDAGNRELIVKEFNRIRKAQRAKVEQEIEKNLKSIEASGGKIDDAKGKAVSAVRTAYENEYTALKEDLSGNGVDIGMKKRTAMIRYNPKVKTEEKKPLVLSPKFLESLGGNYNR